MTEDSLEVSTRFRRWHRDLLLVCVAIMIASFVLSVDVEGRLTILGLPNLALPGLCLWRRFFGVTCPGCGLTRSVILTAHGDLAGAFAANRVGPAVFLIVLLQFPYRIGAFFRKTDYPFRATLDWAILGVLLTSLLANWIWNISQISSKFPPV